MRSPSDWTIGYCTNVHAGTELASIRENLSMYAAAVRISMGLDQLGVGLWLPASAAQSLSRQLDAFRGFLAEHQLVPFTINGFPHDNFHQPVVKKKVYQPAWWEPERLEYTKQLAEILAGLLPEEISLGSISTLPIGWPEEDHSVQADRTRQAGVQLRQLADHLAQLKKRTGRKIIVAIEPEPGCMLDTTDDVVSFFANELPDAKHREHLTICLDVCHAAVMLESQADVFSKLADAGISIGKVQVSNAIVSDWQSMAIGRRHEAVAQLREFAEDRYLHQTSRKTSDGKMILMEDLPELLEKVSTDRNQDPVCGDQRWTVHFHVPIFLEHFGHLMTSQDEILKCLAHLADHQTQVDFTGHLEIETYAWNVMPPSMRKHGLSEDIAAEIQWLRQAIFRITQ